MSKTQLFSRASIMFALIVVVLLSAPVFAQNNVYNATDGAKVPTYVTTATNPTNLRSGVPPVGYEGTKGEYTTVKTDRPLPVVATGTPSTVTTTASQATYVLGTSADTVIVNLSGRREWVAVATSSFQMNAGAATVNTSSVPMTGAGGNDSDAVTLSFRAYLATTSLTIQQRK